MTRIDRLKQILEEAQGAVWKPGRRQQRHLGKFGAAAVIMIFALALRWWRSVEYESSLWGFVVGGLIIGALLSAVYKVFSEKL